MACHQPAILAPVPSCGRFLTFGLAPGGDPRGLIDRFSSLADDRAVLGISDGLVRALGQRLPGLEAFPALSGPGISIPSTQGALWAFLAGDDPGEVLHRARALVSALGSAARVEEDVPSFLFAGGRDLTGYEDGTENPKGERAAEVALVAGQGQGLDGGSFVAVQRWIHDLSFFQRLSPAERDAIIGREQASNEEMEDAPASAHVKRSAQESFEPEAFMLRRSMPFGGVGEHGLYFVSYGASLDAFQRVLRRMVGLEDGVTDGLFRFSRPVTGGCYFCPPLRDGKLDLSALGR